MVSVWLQAFEEFESEGISAGRQEARRVAFAIAESGGKARWQGGRELSCRVVTTAGCALAP